MQHRAPTLAWQLGVAILLGWLLAACGAQAATFLPIRSGEFALVTHKPFANPKNMGCPGVGLIAVVRGDPTDPRIAWLVDRSTGADGGRMDVAWPPGYRARFAPALEILDGTGNVRLRADDPVDGYCGTDDNGGYILELSMPWATPIVQPDATKP